jgi:hypothetical protein
MAFTRTGSQRSTLSMVQRRVTRYQTLLNVTNVALLIVYTIVIFFAVALIKFYHLDMLGFWSVYFVIVPNYIIYLTSYAFGVCLLGLGTTRIGKRRYLVIYSILLALAFVVRIGSIFAALELRSIISQAAIGSADVNEDLSRYSVDQEVTTKWDTLQRDLHCCGGHNFLTGYTDYRTTPIGRTNSVPDSCCLVENDGCGTNIFTMAQDQIRNKIHVHGCLAQLEGTLQSDVLFLLVIYACLGVGLGLMELIAVTLSSAYVAQINRRMKREQGWKQDDQLARISDAMSTDI